MMDDGVRDSVERCVLCWLATVAEDGRPNVSPKEIFAAIGRDRLVIANIASPGSVRNLRATPDVCVSFVDVFVQKGYKLSGTATNVAPDHPRFETLAEPLVTMTKGLFPIRSVIEVIISEVQAIVAPSYHIIPGTTEEGQVRSAMLAYGVQPLTGTAAARDGRREP